MRQSLSCCNYTAVIRHNSSSHCWMRPLIVPVVWSTTQLQDRMFYDIQINLIASLLVFVLCDDFISRCSNVLSAMFLQPCPVSHVLPACSLSHVLSDICPSHVPSAMFSQPCSLSYVLSAMFLQPCSSAMFPQPCSSAMFSKPCSLSPVLMFLCHFPSVMFPQPCTLCWRRVCCAKCS